MGKIINDFHYDRITKLYKDQQHKIIYPQGNIEDLEAILIDEPDPNSSVMQDEIFGPVLPILKFDDFQTDVIDFIRSRPKPLACYYFGKTFFNSHMKEIEQKISAGGMVFNDVLLHIVNPDLPFGGVGASGYGKYHSIQGFKNMSNAKAILVKYPSNFFPFNSFSWPFTNFRKFLLNFFMKYCTFSPSEAVKCVIWLLIAIWIL